jgi:hypothetical protein
MRRSGWWSRIGNQWFAQPGTLMPMFSSGCGTWWGCSRCHRSDLHPHDANHAVCFGYLVGIGKVVGNPGGNLIGIGKGVPPPVVVVGLTPPSLGAPASVTGTVPFGGGVLVVVVVVAVGAVGASVGVGIGGGGGVGVAVGLGSSPSVPSSMGGGGSSFLHPAAHIEIDSTPRTSSLNRLRCMGHTLSPITVKQSESAIGSALCLISPRSPQSHYVQAP